MQSSLINKFRPASFDEVVGHVAIIKSLKEVLASSSRPRTFLLSGPAGVGKTTIARLIANAVDASIIEIDAASNSGIDSTRQIVEMAKFQPLTGNSCQMLIIDECHGLSKQAWQPLLKLTEEPPEWLFVSLATTELDKVPTTIKSRSYHLPLKPLKPPEIEELLEVISELEGLTVINDVFQAIVQASEGSARRAISILQAGHSAASREDLAEIITGVDIDSSPEIELCKHFIKGGKSWKQVSQLLSKIEDFDTAIVDITRYLCAAMARSEEQQAAQIWTLIRAISENQGSWDKRVQLYSGIGRILFGPDQF